MEVSTTRTLSLLTADVNTKKFVAVTRHMMEEALNIGAKVLDRRSKAMWDILLATEEIAKIEYTGTRKILITLHGVHLYITFGGVSDYKPLEEVSSVRCKSGIATNDYKFMVTLSHKKFNEVSNVLTCGGRNMLIVMENRRTHC